MLLNGILEQSMPTRHRTDQ